MTAALFDTAPAAPAPVPTGVGPRPLVVGLDVALGSTGVAGPDWTDRVLSGDRLGEERLDYIVSSCATFYRAADFAVIEGAAFSLASTRGSDELSAIRWMIRCDLRRRDIPFAVVNPNGRIIYATGKAQHKDPVTGKRLTKTQVKGLVRNAVADRYGIDCTGKSRYDEADAFVLASMGLDWLGWPLAVVPETHRRALASVPWPDAVPVVAR